MMPAIQPLTSDLVAALSVKSQAQNLTILQRMTDLFCAGCETFSDAHVEVFDDVISALIGRAPDAALADLSGKLAPLGNAPANVVAELAQHDDMAVAGPVLEKSAVLSDEILADIAQTKSEKHRAAIAARAQIDESVTDALIEYCHAAVARELAANPGARFSALGFVKLINQAKADKVLAETIAKRTDVPSELEPFLKLALAAEPQP